MELARVEWINSKNLNEVGIQAAERGSIAITALLPDLQLVEDFAELPCAGFVVHPFGPSDRSQRKAASRIGIVPQFQHVILAGRGHNMLAVGVADAVRLDRYLDARADSLDDLFERDRRA